MLLSKNDVRKKISTIGGVFVSGLTKNHESLYVMDTISYTQSTVASKVTQNIYYFKEDHPKLLSQVDIILYNCATTPT